MRRLLAALLLLLAGSSASLALAPPAWAHAQLVGTDPAEGAVLPEAPESVTLEFSEPVRLTGRRPTTYDARGTVVDSSATASGSTLEVVLEEPLARGTHLVTWLVVSDDGHPVSGTLTFSVGERSPVVEPPPPLLAGDAMTADRGLLAAAGHLGVLLGAGLAAFLALLHPAPVRGATRVVRGAALLAVVAAWLQVPVASAYAQGLGWAGVLDGFDARLVRWETAAAATVTAGAALLLVGTRSVRGGARRTALLAGAVALVASPALVGHSRSYGPTALVPLADAVHVAVAALWLGGLVGLWLVVRAGDGEASARAVGRFSTVAAVSLVLLAATGALLGWRILGSWTALVSTTYGALLLTKVGLVLLVAGVAAWNRLVLVRRGRPLGRTLLVELALLVAVVGVAGFLANQPPVDPPEPPPAPRPVAETVVLGDLEVVVGLTPGAPGANTLDLQVQDSAGRPVEPDEAPTVELRSAEFDLGTLTLQDRGGGAYRVLVPFPDGGDYRLSVGLRTSRFDHPVVTLEVPIPERD
ncbi:copper resistance CopC/CopD family protein [Nocardioides solisilvae]|uniref:copper resistance CopC/CopD family protein n=1 Tax=Nocardioides solisilvae TaxID=1542435 RepID=UPI0013A56A1B|nr:copper resistance protein CopC [Nocardioides solisilvae]